MSTLRIPTPLRSYTSGKAEVNVNGTTVSDAMNNLIEQYPALKPHLFNEGGDLRAFVNLFLGENNIKDLQGLATPIREGDKLVLIPSIAGGGHCECTLRSNPLGQRGDCFVGKTALLAMTFAVGG